MKKAKLIYLGIVLLVLIIIFSLLYQPYSRNTEEIISDNDETDFIDKVLSGSNNTEESIQGIEGKVYIVPGACNSETGCNSYPGKVSVDVKEYSDSLESVRSNPIVKSFESDNDGNYKVSLPVGTYCIWDGINCYQKFDVSKGKWTKLDIQYGYP